MNSLTLSFNNVNFHPVTLNNGQIWLTGSELSSALGYSRSDAVAKIYDRNSDEFTEKMTQVIDNPQNPNLVLRIFSLRGCHLIAMFARTSVAKEFRKWVLDILDREVGQPVAKTHKSERTALHEAHALLVTKTKHLNVSEAWKMIKQRFNANHIDEIPYDQIPLAVEYVHHLIALYSNADKQVLTSADLQNIHALASHMIWVTEWWRTFGDAIRTMSPTMASSVHSHFADGGSLAWRYIDKSKHNSLREAVKDYEWLLPPSERRQYIRS